MNILAIDQGTKLGYAYLYDNWSKLDSGMVNFSCKKTDHVGKRWGPFMRWIQQFKEVDLIVHERALYRFAGPTKIGYGFVTRIEEYACFLGVPVQEVFGATLKKWSTGSGKATKEDMVATAKIRYPDIEIIDDNHADSLLILDYAMEHFTEGE